MFKISCFIRKNTPELRKKLEDLGYKQVKQAIYYDCIMVENGNIWLCTDIFNPEKADGKGWDECIDCGENEELFLAIAALRDDTDKHQLFTDGQIWIKCGDDHFISNGHYFHKASVKELIEHFKR